MTTPRMIDPSASTDGWSRGDWLQTFTGRRFFPADPTRDDIDPADIAHALSLTCRYGGHVERFYSVAEHCMLMSGWVPEEHALAALLHDATEAYMGDMVRPLKRMIPQYQDLEARLWRVIAAKFGVDIEMPPIVKEADNRILLNERDRLMPNTLYSWEADSVYEPLDKVIVVGLSPARAERLYRERLDELLG